MSFLGKIQIGISEFREDFACFWAIQKRIKMGGFLGSNPNPHFWDSPIELLFWERIWKQYFWPAVFRTKTGYWQQVPYMYDIKTEPMLVTPFFIRKYHFREEHKEVTLSWQWSFFRIFHFFGSKESIGSEITNLFLNSSKKRTPRISGTQVLFNKS